MSSDNGKAALERLIAELTRPPFHGWLKPTAVSVNVERREIEIGVAYRPELRHDSHRGIFHGRVVAALVDIPGYAAVAIWQDAATPTIALHIEYLGLRSAMNCVPAASFAAWAARSRVSMWRLAPPHRWSNWAALRTVQWGFRQ